MGAEVILEKGVQGLKPKKEEAPVNEKRISKRDEASFNTAFISKKGMEEENDNYFAFIEGENYACWALADGYNHSGGAAQIIVEEVMKNFMTEVKFTEKYLKKSIRAAEKVLHEKQKKNAELKGQITSLAVVLSNYNSILIAYIGNVRIYHMVDGLINYKTTDHSVAQLIFEANKMGERELRYHSRRNDLTRALGSKKNLIQTESVPMVLDKGDAILLSTVGAWENLDEREVEVEYSKSHTASEWIVNLEKRMFSSGLREIGNYTLVGIEIEEIAEEKKKKKKKINLKAIIAILVLIGLASYGGYKYYLRVNQKNLIHKEILKYQNESDRFLDKTQYKKSIASLEKVVGEYEKLLSMNNFKNKYVKAIVNKKLFDYSTSKQIEGVKSKIEKINKLIGTRDKLTTVSGLEDEFKYDDALNLCEEVMITYNNLDFAEKEDLVKALIDDLDKDVSELTELKQGMEFKLAGDADAEKNQFEDAVNKYNDAKAIFLKYGKLGLITEINSSIEAFTKEKEKMINTALLYENKAYDIEFLKPVESIEYFNSAIDIYKKLENGVRIDTINEKIFKLKERITKNNQKANEIYQEAMTLGVNEEFEKAILKFNEAKNIYEINSDTDSMKLMDEEVDKLIEKMKKKEDINKAFDIEAQATQKFIEKKFDEAKSLYLEAIGFFENNKFENKVSDLKKRLYLVDGSKLEAMADLNYQDNQLVAAITNYEESLKNYQTYGDSELIGEVELKLKDTKNEYHYERAKFFELEGKRYYKDDEYKDSYEAFLESKDHYSQLKTYKPLLATYDEIMEDLEKRLKKAKKKSERSGWWFW